MRRSNHILIVFAVGALLSTGCVRSHRYPAVVYTPVVRPTVVNPPVSDRVPVRVYPESSGSATIQDTTPAPVAGVSPSDLRVADSISQILRADPTAFPSAGRVQATVDGGIVTLRGTVPTESERQTIQERILRLPGVTSVRNQLAVELR